MIKINIEYTVIDSTIVKAETILNVDNSTTLIEHIIGESVQNIVKDATKNINTNINEILSNIGK